MLYKIEKRPGELILEDNLLEFIEAFNMRATTFKEYDSYYEGKNVEILARNIVDRKGQASGVPDNKIPVSYARKIVQTVVGYEFKPGSLTYNIEDEQAKEEVNDIFSKNNEPIKNAKIGRYMSSHGVAYELHYLSNRDVPAQEMGETVQPRFTVIDPAEIFIIYNYAIEPEKIAAVRVRNQGKMVFVDVYYPQVIIHYEMRRDKQNQKKKLVKISEEINFYGQVPVIEYHNNDDNIGDWQPAKKLIDANDVLMSDSMNEFERFAWAYLLISGMSLENEDAQKIKHRRIFDQLDSGDAVKFLTKDINKEFIQFMTDWTTKEIHKQTFIPDIEALQFGSAASGVTLEKFIYMIEFVASPKEAYFKEGIMERFELLNAIKTEGNKIELTENDIVMIRNTPQSDKENGEVFNMYHGKISTETLIKEFAPFVDNVEEEMERIEEEKDSQINFLETETEEEEQEETEEIEG